MPGLKERLAPNLSLKLERGSFTNSGGHNVLGRVELLEDAVEALLTVQVKNRPSVASLLHTVHCLVANFPL